MNDNVHRTAGSNGTVSWALNIVRTIAQDFPNISDRHLLTLSGLAVSHAAKSGTAKDVSEDFSNNIPANISKTDALALNKKNNNEQIHKDNTKLVFQIIKHELAKKQRTG